MATSYGRMTIPELKVELRKRGAKLTGKKQDLIERIEAYDRNDNFGRSDPTISWSMKHPDMLLYKDINSDSKIPTVTEQSIHTFLSLYEKANSLEKPCDLYQSKFIRSIRFCEDDNYTYISSRVNAEMFTSTIYFVDLKLDVYGVVQESQCECAAGMGPEAHCKHVCVSLYALTRQRSREGILTAETCTQRLQTFHKAKKHIGSPIKTANLELRRNGNIQNLKDFDPRQDRDKEVPSYPSRFRSIFLNLGYNLTILQNYPPANILAVAHDHDYLEKDPEQALLDHIHVSSITKDVTDHIELLTRGQSDNKAWYELRTTRMHSSNFKRMCTFTERTDAVKLAKSYLKISRISSEAIKHGRKYEKQAIVDYQHSHDCEVEESGICVFSEFPHLACSPDGLVGRDGVVEVKCPFTAKDRAVTEKAVPYLKLINDQLVLDENHEYYYQVMGNLMCTERKWCDFVVWTFKGHEVIRIKRDEEFINGMKSRLNAFYNDYFRPALLEKHLYKSTTEYNFNP